MSALKSVNHYGVYSLSRSKWIFKKNIDKKVYPASITKLLTAIIILDSCKLQDKIRIKNNPDVPHFRADLVIGKSYRVEALLRTMLVKSLNDVAVIFEEHLQRKKNLKWPTIIQSYCKKLGLKNTTFTNATGLHNDGHYSTIRDLISLGKKVYQMPTIMNILKMPSSKLLTKYSTKPLLFLSTNPFLNQKGVIAGKTGYTPTAGQCFLFYFKKRSEVYLAVITGIDKENFQEVVYKLIDRV